MAEEELNQSLEYTPTWIVAVVCSIIVFISLIAERALHRLGKVNQLIFHISVIFMIQIYGSKHKYCKTRVAF
jgi:hypothetical protein